MSRYRRRGQDASLAAGGGAIGRSGPYRTAVGGARAGGRRILAAGAAPTAPPAPTLDSATPGNNQVALAWTSNGTGGSPITGYNVLRGTTPGGEALLASGVATTSYTDSTAVNGTTYYYTVEAVNAIGTSAQSNELSATPSSGATAPPAPTLNSASPGNSQVALAWSSNGTGGSPITGYNVLRGTAPGAETLIASGVATTDYTDTGLPNGVEVYYTVEAVNAIGASAESNELAAIPQPAAIPPPVPIAEGAIASAGPLVLTTTRDAPAGSTLLATIALTFSASPTAVSITDAAGNIYSADVPDYATSFSLERAIGKADLPLGSNITVSVTGGTVSDIVATVDAVISAALVPDGAVPTVQSVGSNRVHAITVTEVPGDLMYGVDVAFGAESGAVTTAAPYAQVNSEAAGTGHGVTTASELPSTGNAVSFSDTWPTAHSGAMIAVPYKLAVA